MNRPCFLVIDREYSGSISTRKLIIETAKFNVLTAYSGKEALELFARFPAVSGVVLDGGIEDTPARELAKGLKAIQPSIPIVVIGASGFDGCPQADYHIESFNPAKLLQTLRGIRPQEAAEIEEHDEKLNREQY